MDYVNLGRTGLRVSRVCLGMMSYGNAATSPWALDEDAARADRAPRSRGRHHVLRHRRRLQRRAQSEVVTGRLLAKLLGMREEVRRRDEGVTARRCRARTAAACRASTSSASIDASLRRLELDYVDLYQIHRWDPRTPIEETMEALHDVVRAGKARYIGASSMFAWQFAKAQQSPIAADAGSSRCRTTTTWSTARRSGR